MKSWKSTIGGALSALGTTLMGIGIVPQLSGVQSSFLTHVALVGFIFSGLGTFFGHLFAADNADVKDLRTDVDKNTKALLTGDTEHIKHPKHKKEKL